VIAVPVESTMGGVTVADEEDLLGESLLNFVKLSGTQPDSSNIIDKGARM
jgi:hypothetical protein